MIVALATLLVGWVAVGTVRAYRFYGDPLVPTSETAQRWTTEEWGPGERLGYDIVDDPDWEVYFGSAEEAGPFVEQAMRPWSRLRTADISWGVDGFNAPAEVAEDGINSVFIDEWSDPGTLGYAAVWSRAAGPEEPWELYECDVALGASFASIPEWVTEDEREEFQRSQRDGAVRTLVHEFGHCLGLAHSAALSLTHVSNVHPGDPAMSYGFELEDPEYLSRDDVVGASLLRPASGREGRTGSISGTLSMPGVPVEYAVVSALPVGRQPLRDRVGAFSGSDGGFLIEGLDPGDYVLIAQPAMIGAAHSAAAFHASAMDDVVRGGFVRVAAGRTAEGNDLSMRWGREVRAPYGGAREAPGAAGETTPITSGWTSVCRGVRIRAERPAEYRPTGGWLTDAFGQWFTTTVSVEWPWFADTVFFDWVAPYRDWYPRDNGALAAWKNWGNAAELDIVSRSSRIERPGSVVRHVVEIAWPQAAAPSLRFRSEDGVCDGEPVVVCDLAGCELRGAAAPAGGAPRAVGSIPDQTLTQDGSATTVDVAARFSDPDGDRLSYRATSSLPNVVRVSVSGSRLTLTPGDPGTAHVTVSASDPGGLSATQRFSVTVEPEAPEGATTFGVGDRIPGFQNAAFNGETSGSVGIFVIDGRVTITMEQGASVEHGDYRYTCVASSCRVEEGVVTAGEIERTAAGVGGTPNRAPRAVGSIPDQTLTENGSATAVNVSARFSDPDGDRLTYRATSSRTSVVQVSISGSRLTLTPRDAGTATVTVTATDPGGLSATQRFTVTVTAPANRAPRAVGSVPDQTLTEDGSATAVNVSARFSDPDGDRLTYRATSSRTSVVRVSVSGSRVTLTPRDAGTATVTVTATDPAGLSATQRFAVTVQAAATGSGSCRNSRATPSGSSAALVRDCGVLLEVRDQLRGTASLNWSADRDIASWDGVESDADGVTEVILSSRNLTGTIPDALGNLAGLHELNLWGNSLTGSIPDSLGSLADLRRLSLGRNSLTGSIPDALGNLANLERLFLEYNNLTGRIPDALGNLANLEYLFLDGNRLTGGIPGTLGNLANLVELALVDNNLTGTIPDTLGNLANLRLLFLYGNDLTGRIPDALGKLANLVELALDGNNLTGAIPDWLGNLANLSNLSLAENSLTGSIPGILGNLANLEILWLDNNDLTGAIPDALGNLTNLEDLELSENRLTGCIPERLAAFVSTINPQQGGVRLEVCGTANRAPRTVGSISDQALTEDGIATTVDVQARFSDPDGDRLSYRASSSRTSVVRASASGRWVTLTPGDAGTATVTVTATDPGGLSAAQRFTVTVNAAANRAPRAVGSISNRTLTEDGSATTIDVSAGFSDPDGDALSYRATSSRTSVVRVSVSGSRVTLTPRDAGTATVTVTATDPGGLSATQRFTVTVNAPPTGSVLSADGPLECSASLDSFSGLVSVTASGRIRASQRVQLVEVTGNFIELDGGRSRRALVPALIGPIQAGQSEPFVLTGLFTSTATRFTCDAHARVLIPLQTESSTSVTGAGRVRVNPSN